MNIEQPYKGNTTIEETFSGLIITNHVKKNHIITVFLLFWSCGWIMGEFFGIRSLFIDGYGGAKLFSIVWLCGWTVAGFFVFSILYWQLNGKEIIVFDRGILTISKKGTFMAHNKSFDIAEIKDIKFAITPDIARGFFSFGTSRQKTIPYMQSGNISFGYGLKTVSFGIALDEPEVNLILNLLKEKEILTPQNYSAAKA